MLFQSHPAKSLNKVFFARLRSIVHLRHNQHSLEVHPPNGSQSGVLGIRSCRYGSLHFHRQRGILLMLLPIRFYPRQLFPGKEKFLQVFSCPVIRRDFCAQHRLRLQWLLLDQRHVCVIRLLVSTVFHVRLAAFSSREFQSI